MNILAFDTCFGAVSAAVRWRSAEGEWLLREAYEARTTGHAERLFPMITEIMEDAGLAFSSIDRIGVTLGPGTFTGVRVGIAAARAFALALDRPVVGTTSLAVMAHRADLLIGRERAGRPLAVAVDARRDMIYFQIFPNHTIGAHDALLVTPGRLPASSGGSRCSSPALAQPRSLPPRKATPRFDCQICNRTRSHLPSWRLGLCRSTAVTPIYLREPDAKPQADKALPRMLP